MAYGIHVHAIIRLNLKKYAMIARNAATMKQKANKARNNGQKKDILRKAPDIAYQPFGEYVQRVL